MHLLHGQQTLVILNVYLALQKDSSENHQKVQEKASTVVARTLARAGVMQGELQLGIPMPLQPLMLKGVHDFKQLDFELHLLWPAVQAC